MRSRISGETEGIAARGGGGTSRVRGGATANGARRTGSHAQNSVLALAWPSVVVVNLDSLDEEPDLTDDAARFLARANCLAQLEALTIERYGYPWHEGVATSAVKAMRVSRKRDLSPTASRLLRVSWQTEVGGRFAAAFREVALQRVGAMTLPVNAYYAIFNINRALSLVRDSPIKTHKALHDHFAGRAHQLPLPWGARLEGNADDPLGCSLTPSSLVEPYSFNPLERSHPPEAYLWAALRMTRRWKFDDAREQWLRARENRKKDGSVRKILPKGKPAELRQGLRPTTLLDFVYELRRRAHYVTVDEYGAEISDLDIQRFYAGMSSILDSGMLIAEAAIARYTGMNSLEREADAWLKSAKRVGSWATEPLMTRLEALQTASHQLSH